MTDWLSTNLGTIIVAVMLAAVVVLIIRKLVKDRRAGRSCCGAGCAGCAMNGSCCHHAKNE